MAETQEDEDLKRLAAHTQILIEHFDSVRIFATRHEGESNNTISCDFGAGNFYAQLGQIAEWLNRQNEFVKINARASVADEEQE